ncbi:hypothetical protein JYB87_08895 [Shewanella avicenniae]|uniref:DUF2846 domain-containing protein n=1 Tax=Shewanella avicenniae TaxID=2814294 RepID=A0ABX7QXD0_9GAMM|nr:hypothetical protein [Shewanella avicenniae]QSX35288.1 hypothetical protein JYB87_08895 [Shewanella avicenniae]
MNPFKIVIVCLTLLFAGCASNPMTVSKQVEVNRPSADHAQVVFMRDSFVGAAISASIFDISSGEPVFIGILDNGTKLAHSVTPGKHVFMVVSEAADFMEAELIPGKTYYSIVTPRMGMWKARFSMWPIKANPNARYSLSSADFNDWNTGTKLASLSPKAEAWFEANLASIKAKQIEYWAVWQEKSAADLAQRTLTAEDGQ